MKSSLLDYASLSRRVLLTEPLRTYNILAFRKEKFIGSIGRHGSIGQGCRRASNNNYRSLRLGTLEDDPERCPRALLYNEGSLTRRTETEPVIDFRIHPIIGYFEGIFGGVM
ncbi:MAG: hypothetical protein ABEI54_02025 [Candidatus Bipolaricaulia bacterium]